MEMEWQFILDFVFLSLILAGASLLKRLIKPINNFLIPNAVIAGFIGLVLGPSVLRIIPFSYDRLGMLVYHLMAIGFISIALKKRTSMTSKSSVNTGFFIAASYVIQGIVGFGLTFILIATFFKDIFPPFGFLLPLGFAQGPGQAYSMGTQWEALGFTNGGMIGLTIAAFGFIWAAFGGIILLNIMVRKKKQIGIPFERPKIRKRVEVIVKDFEFSDIDGFTIQLFAIGVVYLVTYLFLRVFTGFIGQFGTFGETFAQVLWGFHFVVGVLFAFLLRGIYNKIRKPEKYEIEYLNDFLLQRIGGGAFDYMVAASIAAISVQIIGEYLIPILILTTVGGFLTAGYSIWISKRIYSKAVLEHIVGMFGTHTGTLSTGIALLREVDPGFESGTAEDLVVGSGLALFLGIPLLMIINLPVLGYTLEQPIYYVLAFLALGIYLGILYVFWFRKARIRRTDRAK